MMILGLLLWTCKPDACHDTACVHGTCESGSCHCENGFEGVNCEIEQRLSFVGSYAVSETCDQGSFHYTLFIEADTEEATELTLYNLGDFGFEAVAQLNGNTIEIHDVDVNGATLNAIGELTGELLTIDYTLLTTSGQALNCRVSGHRQ